MPVYNTADFLPACLDSILAQTYRHWELWAVDDFSTDNSLGILQAYAQKDERIRVLPNKQKGIIDALRLAFAHSRGALVSRMDSDDLMEPHKLAVLAAGLLQKGGGHLAVGAVEYFAAGTVGEGYQKYAAWLNSLIATGDCYRDIYKECVIPSPAWMVWREDLEACGAFEGDRYPEDYDLVFRFYEQRLKPIACTTVVHRWRDHASRASRNDPNYADNRFLELKVHYFLKLDYDQQRPLVLWGAGSKGKKIAKLLQQQNIDFDWICNNPKKIGKHIYGQPMFATSQLNNYAQPQVIIAVAQRQAQATIVEQLHANDWKAMVDYFFFC